MAQIISISRRTDIPAFYTPWLLNRLRSGFCHTVNPFGGQIYQVSLLPEDCLALAFWTRNPAPLFPHLDELDARGYCYFFNQTITGYPAGFETHGPSLKASLDSFRKLSDRMGPWRIHWRYDPVILSSRTPPEYHLHRFAEIAAVLEGSTDHCTFSFLQFYGKTSRNLAALTRQSGLRFDRPGPEEQAQLARSLAEIAAAHGMSLNACCSDHLVGSGVQKNHCIDLQVIRRLNPEPAILPEYRPTRKECGCLASIDIGAYDTCLFGCTYCYATNSRAVAMARHARHDPQDTFLVR
jgi:hypothetical protein